VTNYQKLKTKSEVLTTWGSSSEGIVIFASSENEYKLFSAFKERVFVYPIQRNRVPELSMSVFKWLTSPVCPEIRNIPSNFKQSDSERVTIHNVQ
jgi:hypothetical protein